MSVHRRILSDALLVTAIGAVVQAVAFVATILIAKRFGAGATMDAYYLALAVPNVLMGVLGGTIKIVVIPFFVEERMRRPEEAQEIVRATSALLVVSSVAGMAIIAALAWGGFLEFGATPEIGNLARLLILELLLLIPLTVMFHFYNAIYNSYQRFALAEVSQALRYVVLITCLVAFSGRWGIQSLVAGHIAGQAIALTMMIFLVWRQLGIELKPLWALPAGLKRILIFSFLPFLSYVFVQLNPLVARVIATQLQTGSIAVFSYAEKLASIPNLIIGAGFAGVLVSHWSRLSVEGEREILRDNLNRGLSILLVMLMPLAVGLVMLREPLVSVVFERGAFDMRAAELTADVFAVLAVQIVPAYLHMVTVRVLLAEKDTRALMWLSVLAFVLNLISMQAFIWLGFGVVGLALGALTATTIVAGATALLVDRRYSAIAWKALGRDTMKIVLAAIVMAGTLIAAGRFFTSDALFSGWLRLLGGAVLGIPVYFLTLKLLGHGDLTRMWKSIPRSRGPVSISDQYPDSPL